MRLICDNVDHSRNSVRSVEGGGCTFKDFDSFYPTHVDPGEVNVTGNVSGHFLPVHENEDIISFHSVKGHVCTHSRWAETKRGI